MSLSVAIALFKESPDLCDSDNDAYRSENSDPDHYQRFSRLTTIDDPVLLVILISVFPPI